MADDDKKKTGTKESRAAHDEHDHKHDHSHGDEKEKPAKKSETAAKKDAAKDAEAAEKKEGQKESPATAVVKESTLSERRLSKAKERKLKSREKRAKRELKPGEIPVLSIDGDIVDAVRPPAWFARTPYRPDVIRRAVDALQANRRQPYGPPITSGMRHAVYWWGKGRGVARTPRLKASSRGAQAPNTVGGRRAHPPKIDRDWSKKMNNKEMGLARLSALRASADPKLVAERGHRFSEDTFIPVVIEDEIEKLVSTVGEMVPLLKKAGVYPDVLRSKEGTGVRAGRGKMRGRRYREPRSILFIVRDAGAAPAALNLAGAEVRTVASVNVEDLAPGGHAGRLVVFSKSAFEEVGKWA